MPQDTNRTLRSFKRVERSLATDEQLLVDATTSKRMGRVRQANTKPEQLVRRVAYSVGLRYRIANRSLPGSPDLSNQSKSWVIFVHGCYWHRHAGCSKATTPKRNREFWLKKFEANQRRDTRVRRKLRRMGFRTLTVWECQTKDSERLINRLENWAARNGLL